MIPCEGIFSDIWIEDVEEVTAYSHGMEEIFRDYELYKNQFIKDLDYPIAISGKEIRFSNILNIPYFIRLQVQDNTALCKDLF